MAGRRPTPAALHVLNGNPGKRARNAHEPEPDLLDKLDPPAHLPERSAAVWRELAWMLRKAKILTVADVVAFEMLCDSVADYRFLRHKRGDTFTATSAKGSQMLDQELVAENMLAKRAENLMGKFGMTPSDRSKVMVDPQLGLFGEEGDKPTGTSRFFKT